MLVSVEPCPSSRNHLLRLLIIDVSLHKKEKKLEKKAIPLTRSLNPPFVFCQTLNGVMWLMELYFCPSERCLSKHRLSMTESPRVKLASLPVRKGYREAPKRDSVPESIP